MIPNLHLGPLTIPTFGLTVALALITAACILQADFNRRGMKASAFTMVAVAGMIGILGAKIYHLAESPSDFPSDPFRLFFSRHSFAWFGGFLSGFAAILYLGRRNKLPMLELLDVCSPAATFGYAIGQMGCFLFADGDNGRPTSLPWGMSSPNGLLPTTQRVHPTPLYEFLVWCAIGAYLWHMSTKATRGPKAKGEIFANYLIFTGLARFLVEFLRLNPRPFLGMSNAQLASGLSLLAGLALLWRVKSRFYALKKEHRVLDHIFSRGDVLQKEYHRPTPECPHPERWRMYDSMTAELEVLDFLKSLVTTLKPELVVETGTFSGLSTLRIAEGLKQNRVGHIITCEWDKKVYECAKKRFAESGLAEWIDLRNESSFDIQVPGKIDMLFCDSDPERREQEVRRFLPQMNPYGVILIHDASSHMKTVRQGALRLEAEGLLSVLLLPTPRGLVLAQKREGRS